MVNILLVSWKKRLIFSVFLVIAGAMWFSLNTINYYKINHIDKLCRISAYWICLPY